MGKNLRGVYERAKHFEELMKLNGGSLTYAQIAELSGEVIGEAYRYRRIYKEFSDEEIEELGDCPYWKIKELLSLPHKKRVEILRSTDLLKGFDKKDITRIKDDGDFEKAEVVAFTGKYQIEGCVNLAQAIIERACSDYIQAYRDWKVDTLDSKTYNKLLELEDYFESKDFIVLSHDALSSKEWISRLRRKATEEPIFSTKVEEYRLSKGLSRLKLSKLSGVAYSKLTAHEQLEKKLADKDLKKIAEVLEVTLRELKVEKMEKWEKEFDDWLEAPYQEEEVEELDGGYFEDDKHDESKDWQ